MPSQLHDFNSRPSARGDAAGAAGSPPADNFNSRPSARGDWSDEFDGVSVCISIHAPPRGATSMNSHMRGEFPFQFTPLREGRPGGLRVRLHRWNFNSRPSARGDRWPFAFPRHEHISIHAPPRGATLVYAINNMGELFQFTPLREGRHLSRWQTPFPTSFQFTPLREGRPFERGNTRRLDAFQFTPLREGRHAARQHRRQGARISIHAPPRGATRPPRRTP